MNVTSTSKGSKMERNTLLGQIQCCLMGMYYIDTCNDVSISTIQRSMYEVFSDGSMDPSIRKLG